MLALGGSLWGLALADTQPAGIAGTVVDARSGAPIGGAKLYYYKTPYSEKTPNMIKVLPVNGHGSFSDINLEPGRYVIMARVPGKVEGCALDDVIGGEVTHVKITIGNDTVMCSGPRVHPTLVDPNATADVYRI